MSDSQFAKILARVDAAIEADEGGDSARCLQLVGQIELLMATLPDGKNEDSEASFDREAISRSLITMKRKHGAKCGVITEVVRYRRG
ncbi:hypothetical protein [Rhodopirellula bahusiensis]|uniref:hypothetical protein n=1 Tax=Rhodopirellula bahusiensis TaxID=2014065 RepID=UPI00326570BE